MVGWWEWLYSCQSAMCFFADPFWSYVPNGGDTEWNVWRSQYLSIWSSLRGKDYFHSKPNKKVWFICHQLPQFSKTAILKMSLFHKTLILYIKNMLRVSFKCVVFMYLIIFVCCFSQVMKQESLFLIRECESGSIEHAVNCDVKNVLFFTAAGLRHKSQKWHLLR